MPDELQPVTPPERRDFRKEVTNNLIAMLERGTAPWQKPWDPEKGAALAMPMNPTTEKAYRGGNALHLLAMGASRGYEDPRWMTYRQAQEHGWQVRKGERGSQIEFWQFREGGEKETNAQPGLREDSPAERNAPLHRVYTVFNAQQIDGIPAWEPKARSEWEAVQSAENILAGLGVRVLHDQADRAYYSLNKDEIHLPPRGAFGNEAQYYGTALHEAGHATGQPDRLNRETLTKSGGFGTEAYAREELRAELTSLFLAAERDIPHDPGQHAAYVNAWIAALKQDKNEIFRAAKDAANATEFLLEHEKEIEREGTANSEAVELAPVHHENAEWTADFNPQTGAVLITEKDTAIPERELYEPEPHAAMEGDAPTRAQQQIDDDQVHGVVAPHHDPREPHAAALDRARAIVEQEMGEAQMEHALTDSGHYDGPIIGKTSDYAIQRYTSGLAILHDNERVGDLEVDRTQSVVIDYDRGEAEVRLESAHEELEHEEAEMTAELEM